MYTGKIIIIIQNKNLLDANVIAGRITLLKILKNVLLLCIDQPPSSCCLYIIQLYEKRAYFETKTNLIK